MKNNENKKINKIEKLVETIAANTLKITYKVDNVDKDVGELKRDVGELKRDVTELKEGGKDIRNDIFNLGDRFVSYHTFDQLAFRVSALEKKRK